MVYKRVILMLLIVVLSGALHAEVLIGRVVDSETKMPIESVDIDRMMLGRGNGYNHIFVVGSGQGANGAKYAQTDSLGRFTLYVSQGSWSLTFMQIGYKNVVRTLVCKGTYTKTDTVNLGDIEMKMSKVLLKEVVIKGQRKKFYLRGDTVIYDPLAFNLKEGDRIERLLQKLPGVDRTGDGQLMWMGKPLTMIMNGQDNNVAASFLPNIAVEAVENIKLYQRRNKMDSLRQQAGEHVLDVKIKREWMEKWYGDVSLMGQTEHYYDVNANAYRLSDKVPVYVYGDLGDGNHDYYPGGGGSKGEMYKDKNMRIKNQVLGANASHMKNISNGDDYLNDRWNLHPNLHHSDRMNGSRSKGEQYLTNGTTYSESRNNYYDHNFQVDPIVWSYDHSTNKGSYMFDISTRYSRSTNESKSADAKFSDSPYRFADNPLDKINATDAVGDSLRKFAVNSSNNNSYSVSDNYNINVAYRGNIRLKKNNVLVYDTRLSYDDSNRKTYSLYDTKYYKDNPHTSLDKQYHSAPSRNFNSQLNLRYSHQFSFYKHEEGKPKRVDYSKNLQLSISNNISYNRSYTNERIYRWVMQDLPAEDLMNQLQFLPPEYQDLLNALDKKNSTRKDLRTLSNKPNVSMSLRLNKWTYAPSIELDIANEHLDYKRGVIDTVASRTIYSPVLSQTLSYAKSMATRFSISMNYATSHPDMMSQMAYTDDTNPLYIREGNPGLKKGHGLGTAFTFNSTIARLQMMMYASLSCRKYFSATSSQTLYDPATGVYRTKMVNTRGGYQMNGSYNIECFVLPKLKLKNETSVYVSKRYSILNSEITSPQQVLNAQRSCIINNILRLGYYGNNLELNTSFNVKNQTYRNSARQGGNYSYWDYVFGLNAKYIVANTWSFNVSCDYDNKCGYMSDMMNRDHLLVDASVDWKVMRNRGVVTFGASDIFKEYNAYNSYVDANERSESIRTSFSNYYYVKFCYHFDGRKNKQ